MSSGPRMTKTQPSGGSKAGPGTVFEELEALVGYIRNAKREIASLCPDEVREKHIRVANDELDAIIAHTEEATSAILDAAESIETVAGSRCCSRVIISITFSSTFIMSLSIEVAVDPRAHRQPDTPIERFLVTSETICSNSVNRNGFSIIASTPSSSACFRSDSFIKDDISTML